MASGGGIFFNGSRLTILESTFSGNTAHGEIGNTTPGNANGGGIECGGGTLTLAASTLSGNSVSAAAPGAAVGGAIDNETQGMVRVQNTIVAGNSPAASSDVSGSLHSLGHNLIGIGDGGSGYADADLVGTSANPIDAKLGPLQDNGGPTETMALLPGSPAIDAGGLTDSEWDQRAPAIRAWSTAPLTSARYEVQDSAEAALRARQLLQGNYWGVGCCFTQPTFGAGRSRWRHLHAEPAAGPSDCRRGGFVCFARQKSSRLYHGSPGAPCGQRNRCVGAEPVRCGLKT